MKKIRIGSSSIMASEVALGCMRISGMGRAEAANLLSAALDAGIDFFDHADIYGGGKSEEVFAGAIDTSPSSREKYYIQTKCGIRSGYFDFSYDHIVSSVEGSLKRLKTDYIDLLLLHRPDTLMEPEEVARAFDRLHTQGKVRAFGMSNQKPMQIQLLQKYLKQPIVANQLQFSITNAGMIDSGLNVNMENALSVDHDDSVLEFCRLNDITIQPWSPFQHGFFSGVFLDNPKFPKLNEVIDRLAKKYGVTNSALAIAWILRHPAHMQPIIGTTNAKRVTEIARASDITLTREEWYEVYKSAGKVLP